MAHSRPKLECEKGSLELDIPAAVVQQLIIQLFGDDDESKNVNDGGVDEDQYCKITSSSFRKILQDLENCKPKKKRPYRSINNLYLATKPLKRFRGPEVPIWTPIYGSPPGGVPPVEGFTRTRKYDSDGNLQVLYVFGVQHKVDQGVKALSYLKKYN